MTVVAPTPDGRDFVGKQWDFSNVEPGKTGIFQCKDWEWRPKSRFLALGTTTMDDAAINAQGVFRAEVIQYLPLHADEARQQLNSIARCSQTII